MTRTTFRAIKEEITQRIGDKRWAPGCTIPSEHSLAIEFGVARGTVNRALQELARAGLVERKRRAGTRVVLHPIREARFAIPLVAQEIAASGAAYRYHLLYRAERAATTKDAERLGIEPGEALLHIRCVHYSNDQPYQFEDRLINPAIEPDMLKESFEKEGPNEWLVAVAPFSRAEFTFLAGLPSAEEAHHLGIDPQSPVFIGERRTWLLARPITAVKMIHPHSHRLTTTL